MGSLSPVIGAWTPVRIFPKISLCAAGKRGRRPAAKANGHAHKGRVRSTRNRVLMFGNVRELALYRAEVLRAHGFTVTVPESEAEAGTAVRRGGFDVAVLSYTLSTDTVEEIVELVRQHCPDCRLVTISDTNYRDLKINPDANVLADDGPQGLLQALRSTLRRG